jgi:hypothetical protein
MPAIAEGFGQGNGLGVVFVQGGLNRCALAAGEDQAQRLNTILILGLSRRDLQEALLLAWEIEVSYKADKTGSASGFLEHFEHALLHGRVLGQVDPFEAGQCIDGDGQPIRGLIGGSDRFETHAGGDGDEYQE